MNSPAPEIFLSYSRNDRDAAGLLRDVLVQKGLVVFKDDASLHAGDRWLTKLQEAVGGCGAFVVLVGKDGVQRWIGAEVEVALIRHLHSHEDKDRLPIFPILLGASAPESLPPFLALFQATRWDGKADLPDQLINALRTRQARFDSGPAFEGPPFLGLRSFTCKDSHLFFGRRRETLEALSGLGDQTETNPENLASYDGNAYKRWLQIEGNSGSGKSSLLQAGLLPMIERGALWARTGIEHWQVLGPMMPGRQPVEKLAEVLERGLVVDPVRRDTLGRLARLEQDERALAFVLREQCVEKSAFVLIIDQFEELFTFADDAPRKAFDALLANALLNPECPLFVISTVRADFLDRFDQLPRLAAIYNSLCKRYFLPSISEQGLEEVIDDPAKLAGLDVSEVRAAILEDAREEMAGALPLVENALYFLWDESKGKRLSGDKYRDAGKLTGLLVREADKLLAEIEAEAGMAGRGKSGALELLLHLTRVNEDGRNTRQRLRRQDAVIIAGGGSEDIGERILRRLSGDRDGNSFAGPRKSLRLIIITIERDAKGEPIKDDDGKQIGHVDLIHETLIRTRSRDEQGRLIGYWPTLFDYVEANRHRELHRRQLELQARRWRESRGLGAWRHLAGLTELSDYRPLAVRPGSVEADFLRWSRRTIRVYAGIACVAVLGIAFGLEYRVSERWGDSHNLPRELIWLDMQWRLEMKTAFPEMGDEIAAQPVSFSMGCNPKRDEETGIAFKCSSADVPHDVTLNKPYRLGRYEVTTREYLFFLRDSGAQGSRRTECKGRRTPAYPEIKELKDLDLPAAEISWCDANAYVEWLNVRQADSAQSWRLPTEAEWEYAARGKTGTAYWWGPEYSKGEVNCDRNGKGPWPVTRIRDTQQKPPFGLYDMLGNAWEWVEDAYAPYEKTPQTNPVVAAGDSKSLRVLRGGSWYNLPEFCRAAWRSSYDPVNRDNSLGFRVCRGSPIDPRNAATLDR